MFYICRLPKYLFTTPLVSAVNKFLRAIAVRVWSCELSPDCSLCLCPDNHISAINSVESSARNFAAFQNVAKALNGTSAASTAPNTTTTTTTGSNGAIPVRMGGAGSIVAVIAIVAILL